MKIIWCLLFHTRDHVYKGPAYVGYHAWYCKRCKRRWVEAP